MSRYANTKVSRVKIDRSVNEVLKYDTTLYQKIPESNEDIFVVTQEGDRLDNLAFQFYGNQHLWWYIAQTNNLNTMNIPVGTSLRIPASTEYAKGK